MCCDMDKCLLRDAGRCSGSIKCTHIHSPALFGRRLMHPENRERERQRQRDRAPHGQRRVFHCRYLVGRPQLYPIPLSLSLSLLPLSSWPKGKMRTNCHCDLPTIHSFFLERTPLKATYLMPVMSLGSRQAEVCWFPFDVSKSIQ